MNNYDYQLRYIIVGNTCIFFASFSYQKL